MGTLRRPDTYLRWAKADGLAVVRSLASPHLFSLFGSERAVTRQIWKEFRQAAECEPIADTIAAQVAAYLRGLAVLAEECTSLPRAFPSLRRLVAVPRALCNAVAFEGVRATLKRQPELTVLRGGPAFLDFFSRELVMNLDGALSSDPPTMRRPMISRNEWLLVGADMSFAWAAPVGASPAWYGHYFLYESKAGRFTGKVRQEIASACDALQQSIVRLKPEQRYEILRAARVSPIGRMAL